ncbi:MAG: hypothetical protein Barrevirus6_7 [Barrevirus sp.]|uniref:Uncharacterized protein n=1 Tax=Barrevirus sp. TaxID=2487763 RepID=A0A3G4ZU63_9VIRU|nr:MAG: hypothetical protein Barrevirus6_7 [Barrevirus sp.]
MNLINFHTFEKNKKYIQENKCMTIGQGLSHSWSIMLYGNGYNKYFITVSYLDKEYTIVIEEKHICEWSIRSKYEEGDEEYENIKFDAFGKLDDYYYRFSNCDNDDDFNHLSNNNCKKVKIIDITIENNQNNVPLINS